MFADPRSGTTAAGTFLARSGPGGIFYNPPGGIAMARDPADSANEYADTADIYKEGGRRVGELAFTALAAELGGPYGLYTGAAAAGIGAYQYDRMDGIAPKGALIHGAKSGLEALIGGAILGGIAEDFGSFGGEAADVAGAESETVVCRPGSTTCFVAGTLVQMADGSTKAIEQVQAGDLVYTRNSISGVVESKHVEKTFVGNAPELVTVRFAQAGDTRKLVALTLQGTPEHPVFTPGSKMVKLGDLGIGSQIVTRAGPPLVVVSTTRARQPGGYTVYNFRVADDHTYFVGRVEGGVWVHNAGEGYIPDVNSYKDAYEAIERRDVRVRTRAEAEDIARQRYAGYKNTTGLDEEEAKWRTSRDGNPGFYHWQDEVLGDVASRQDYVDGHKMNNNHGSVCHLQIEPRVGKVRRVFFGPNIR